MNGILLVVVTVLISLPILMDASPQRTTGESKKVAIYAPRPKVPFEARAKHLCASGICAVHVRSDGTVSDAFMAQSTGYDILDKASIEGFSKWRFIKGAPRTIKIPVSYTYCQARTP